MKGRIVCELAWEKEKQTRSLMMNCTGFSTLATVSELLFPTLAKDSKMPAVLFFS